MDAPFASPTSVLNRYYTKRQGGAFAFVIAVVTSNHTFVVCDTITLGRGWYVKDKYDPAKGQ